MAVKTLFINVYISLFTNIGKKEIDDLTNIAAAEMVAEELAEEIGDELVELEIGSQEVTTEAVESDVLNTTEDSQSTNSEEGSGYIDFGDIMEVVL